MLIALLTVLVMGGGEQNTVLNFLLETEGRVANAIPEPDRRDEVRRILGQMERRNSQLNQSTEKRFRRLQSELAKPTPDRVAMNAVLDNQYAALRRYNQDMIDLRFELRDQLTREEWDALFTSDD